ncbi:hypothetical protein [Alistipes finegoldii]|uniref:hypothetical protein n=1 Tax=Alistipes finegoldii TaxID=214856 RepID=UPI00272F7C17|nr:hypothetical protein [Alistipes finegoldii]
MFFLTVGKRVSSRFFCTLFAAHDGSAFPPAGFLVFRRFSFFSPVAFFCPVAVSSSSRQQTFFFFGGSLFPLRRPFSSRCRFSFLSCKLFLSSAVLFSPSAAFLVPLLFPPLPASKLSFSSAVLFFVRQSFLSRNGFPRCFSG